MEKFENLSKYLPEMKTFIDTIVLNESKSSALIDSFKKHDYFRFCEQTVKDLEKDDKYGKRGVLLFIFSMFVRDRETCDAITQILDEVGLSDQAKQLKKFNTSSGPMKLTNKVELEVKVRPSPSITQSGQVALLKDRRGPCIIINNVEDAQEPPYFDHGQKITPIGLKKETERFKYIFEKYLLFNVKVFTKLSAKQIKEELIKISKDPTLKNEEGIVLIVISHGQNEAVLGYDATEALRKIKFREIKSDSDIKEALEVIKSDQVDIKELNDIFSEENCSLKSAQSARLLYFICCRDNFLNKQAQTTKPGLATKVKVENKETKAGKSYCNTFVSYSCAEGFESFYDSINGFSYFGQAFAHSVAQYSCEYTLGEIMTRTSKRLEQMYKEEDGRPDYKGCYCNQINLYAMSFQLYLNPGHFKANIN